MHCTTATAKDLRARLGEHKKNELDRLLAQLDRCIATQTSKGKARKLMACWDFDGTVLAGDITEGRPSPATNPYKGMIDVLVEADLLPGYKGPGAQQQIWQHYQDLMVQEGKLRAYVFLAELLAELSPAEENNIHQHLDRMLVDYYKPHVFAEAWYLLEAMEKRNVQNVIISASPHLFVGKGARLVGIADHYYSGIDRRLHQGVLIDDLVNHAEGKRQRVQQFMSQQQMVPIFAAGNSWESDGPMLAFTCEQGGMALLVNDQSRPAWAHDLPIYQLHFELPQGVGVNP